MTATFGSYGKHAGRVLTFRALTLGLNTCYGVSTGNLSELGSESSRRRATTPPSFNRDGDGLGRPRGIHDRPFWRDSA
jgi:hypothetical protein